jgi:hypothetical protein
MSQLRQLFYVSRVADAIDARAVRNILAISRRNNRMLDVTGCLTFTGRHFAQIIEGRPDAVETLRQRIGVDHRHADFRPLLDRELTLRDYPLWSMAFLNSEELADDLEGLFEGVPTCRKALLMMGRLKPDTVMGAL